jgi:hypothetical protein
MEVTLTTEVKKEVEVTLTTEVEITLTMDENYDCESEQISDNNNNLDVKKNLSKKHSNLTDDEILQEIIADSKMDF